MPAMSAWLKTVITVILLATFVDLLLPSSTMQRYVRTVMSLFVLLTLLAPVVQLFQRSWEPQQLFSLVEGEQVRMAAAEAAGGAMPSLAAIQRKADELKAANARQEKKLVETELASQIKSRLQGETALQVAAVTVTTAPDKQNKPYIQNVQISLGPAKATSAAPASPASTTLSPPASSQSTGSASPAGTAGSQATPSSGAPPGKLGEPIAIEIKPVDPVRIRIQGDSDQHTAAAAAPVTSGVLPPEYRQDQAVITRVLGQEYQLPADRIRTTYVGTARAS